MDTTYSNVNSCDFELQSVDSEAIRQFLDRAKTWAIDNQWAVGVAEMALGASLLAWGIQHGAIEVGAQILGTSLTLFPSGGEAGALLGSGIGATAAAYVGSIGVAAMGTAIAVPAVVLIGAGASVFGAFGYIAGEKADAFLSPSFADMLGAGSAALVGVALLVDGGRRLIKDEKFLKLVSAIVGGKLHLNALNVPVIARTLEDLQNIAQSMASMPEDTIDASGSLVSGIAAGAAGTAAGAAVAAGTVTVLGSTTLGSAALALGLVSAPLWPAIAGGALGLTVGYGIWKGARHYINTSLNDASSKTQR